MGRQGFIDIGMNDEQSDIIRKINYNFKLINSGISKSSSEISGDIDDIIDQFTDALNGIADNLSQAIYDERIARQNKDEEIENNYCPLNQNGIVDSSYLPSYVDDVVEVYPRQSATELGSDWLSLTSGGAAIEPESGKIYILLAGSTNYAANTQFRWGGSVYIDISSASGVSGVKGSAEQSYRTGNVNLSPGDINALALSGGTMTGDIEMDGVDLKYGSSPETAYPIFIRSSWSTSSDETTLPTTPCFVLDTSSGGLYWCDGT